ncbi:hypothetical protein M405DRAFT_821918 [Rhizopogon salebrosus TDB-379]|nr:hypothetical protein M405DRAFT_821918 [Rhizopogon salebrosus TDB-379]
MRMMKMLLAFLAVVPMRLLLMRLTLLTSRLKYRSHRFSGAISPTEILSAPL